jgi:hypothetical protein
MKVTLELQPNLIPLLSRDQLEEILLETLLRENSAETQASGNTILPPTGQSVLKPLKTTISEDVVKKPKTHVHKRVPAKMYSDELILEIAKRYENGESLADLARLHDMKYSTLHTRLSRLGVLKKKS